MKAILPKESSLEGMTNQSTPSPHAILYANLNTTKCNMLMQTKRNPKLHGLTSMQSKNQNRKDRTIFPYA